MKSHSQQRIPNTHFVAAVLATLLVGFSLSFPLQAFVASGSRAASHTTPIVLAAMAAPMQEEHAAPEEHPAAEEHAAGEEAHGEAHGPLETILHWLNFLLLVGALVYLVKKLLAPFLEERGRLIREDMERSAKTLVEASQRLSAVEEKLQGMDSEMATLRQAAFRESAAERERIEQAAAAEAEKITVAADQEIDAAVKAARQDLKRYTSELALGLAEQKIRQSLTPESERRILGAFVKELSESGETAPGSNSGGSSRRS